MTHYEVLGVDPAASAEQIRAAYHKLVAQYHPDRHQGNPLEELAREKLVRINDAYQTLNDARRRAAYDASLRDPRPHSRPPSAQPTAPPARVMKMLLLVIVLIAAWPLLARIALPLFRLIFRALRALLSLL